MIWANTIAADPARDPRPGFPERARHPVQGGRADGDRGPGDADPGGPRPADERDLCARGRSPGQAEHAGPADGGDRVACRGRHDLRGQDGNPHRRRAGTGRDRARGRSRGRGRRARARSLRRICGRAQPHASGDRRQVPLTAGAPRRRGSLLFGLEVVRADAQRRLRSVQLRDGRARRPDRERLASARARPSGEPGRAHRRGAARGGVRGGPRRPAVRPGFRASPAPSADRAGRARGAPPRRRRGDDRVHARAAGRSQADLGRRPLDGHRRGLCDRRAQGRRRHRGPRSAGRPRAPGRGRSRRTRSSAGSRPSRRRRWSPSWPSAGASPR